MGYLDIYDRMRVDVPVGEYQGMKIMKFEVKDPDDWTEADEKRKDVVSPLQYFRMQMDGRAPRPGWYTRLSEGNTVWMSDTTAERRDHAQAVFSIGTLKAERVIINGLGIGMVLSAALSYGHVKHVDVVEMDERIIHLMGPHYLKDPRVRIHHADAREQMQMWGPDEKWDVGWTDIWPDINAENLPEMRKFSEFYDARCAWHGNWSEDMAKRSAYDCQDFEYLTSDEIATFEEEDEQYDEDYDEDYDDEDEEY